MKNVCLYINVKLTIEVVNDDSTNLIPMYPSESPHDSRNKIEIFKLSILSMKNLQVPKIIANIEFDEHHKGAASGVFDYLHNVFPKAEIISEPKRPTNLADWKISAEICRSFFGDDLPILCIFNHDHIFVEYNLKHFYNSINPYYEKLEAVYLVNCHFPESVFSRLGMYLSTEEKETCYPWLETGDSEPLDDGCLFCKNCSRIDSFFITNAAGLSHLWRSVSESPDYMPRPDWPSVAYKEKSLHLVLPKREFFRHFDGYGHVTSLSDYLAHKLSDFDNASGLIKYRKKLLDELNANADVRELSTFYKKLFYDQYLLGAVGLLRARRASSEIDANRRGIIDIQLLLKIFIFDYIVDDFNAFGISRDKFNEVFFETRHLVFNELNKTYLQIISDAELF